MMNMAETEFRDPGEVPALDWIDKSLIDIDTTYQRGLDEGRVQKIVDWFAWDSFGAIVVAPATDGRYNAIDGQHRLEAAKRHPKVSVVPAVVIVAGDAPAEASSFVAINRDRKNVTPLDLYWAELAAGDPEAQTVAQVCARAGVTIVKSPGGQTKRSASDTVSVGAIRSLVDRRGAQRARQILEVLAEAQLMPITSIQIRAAEMVLTDPEFFDQVEPVAVTEAIRGNALVIEGEASAFAATHRVPKAKAFANVWFRRCKKRRKAVTPVEEPSPMTRGEALRQAEVRETSEMLQAELRAAARQQNADNDLATIIQAFDLTRTEAKLVKELLSGKLASKDALHAALYSDDIDGGPDVKIIDVLVCKVRVKLERHQIDVQTIRGMGYKMVPEMVRRTNAAIRQNG